MAQPSPFALKIASIAQEQHTKFQFTNEADPILCKQIKKWTKDIGAAFVSCTKEPWSAVFISWCVLQAGATKSEFRFSKAHSVFVHKAIQDDIRGIGVFHGREINIVTPAIGDIIHFNRGGNKFDFDFAKANTNYISHSVIVSELGTDAQGNFALCIGGNESDSIRRTKVRLNTQGFIIQRKEAPFISIVKTLK